MSVLKQLKGITKRTFKYLTKDVYDVNSDKSLDEIIRDLKKRDGGNANAGIITVGDSLGMYNVLTNDNATDERCLNYSKFASEFRHGISDAGYDFLNHLLYKNGIIITFEKSEFGAGFDVLFNFGENENYFCTIAIETDQETEQEKIVVGDVGSDVEEDNRLLIMSQVINTILYGCDSLLTLLDIIDVE